MRVLLERAIEVSRRNELAQIAVALLIFRQQDEPVDRLFSAEFRRSRDAEHGSDDRLNALLETGVAERHDAVETVPVRNSNCREAELRGALGDDLRLHRSFEHRERREYPEGNVRLIHGP